MKKMTKMFCFSWSAISALLCNKSSIEATYTSNHTLQTLSASYDDGWYHHGAMDIPVGLYSHLRTNQSPNKAAVARKKIVEHHAVEDLNFAVSSLPTVFSAVGKVGANNGLFSVWNTLQGAS
jgi:hypothetical protein